MIYQVREYKMLHLLLVDMMVDYHHVPKSIMVPHGPQVELYQPQDVV
jgi:hypothetical protein